MQKYDILTIAKRISVKITLKRELLQIVNKDKGKTQFLISTILYISV